MSARGQRFEVAPSDWTDEVIYRRGGDAAVGASLLQTPGAIQSEMEKIDGEMGAHDADLRRALSALGFDVSHFVAGFFGDMWEGVKDIAIPGHAIDKAATAAASQVAQAQHARNVAADLPANAPPLARFYVGTWLPWFRSWASWYEDNNGWFSNFMWNKAPDAEAFQRKLVDMRQAAESQGMKWQTPPPDIEGKSILDPRNPGPAEALDSLAGFVKIALYVALALGGALGVAAVVGMIRGGRGRR